jgi:hypothetical protein
MPKNFVSVLYGMSLPANVTCGNKGLLSPFISTGTTFAIFSWSEKNLKFLLLSV